jgi:hypothetical protein
MVGDMYLVLHKKAPLLQPMGRERVIEGRRRKGVRI